MNNNLLEQLETIGLTEKQALTYQGLLQYGIIRAGVLSKKTGVKPGMTYKCLEDLETMGLVKVIDQPSKATLYEPTHPRNLEALINAKTAAAKAAAASLDQSLGGLSSAFNLLSGKPNVQFYEGVDGIKKVLWDSLRAQETVYQITDLDQVKKYFPELNEEYIKQRLRKKISKQVILRDTQLTRGTLAKYPVEGLLDIKLGSFDHPLQASFEIYDGKISYVTVGDGLLVGVIIEDQRMYDLHRQTFDLLWSQLPSS